MKVLFTYSVVGQGGDAVQTLAIVQALRNLGHEVHMIGPHLIRPYDFVNPLFDLPKWIYTKAPRWFRELVIDLGLGFITLWKARRWLKLHKADMIFHRAHIYDIVGSGLAKAAGCPIVALLDAPYAEEWSMVGKKYSKRLHDFTLRRLAKNVALCVTISQFAQHYFLEFGIPSEKIVVQPNGISEKELQEGMLAIREYPPLKRHDQVIIGYIGSLTPWHRVDLLLEALQRLLARGQSCYRLVIIGKGWKFDECQKLCSSLELQEYVQWVGPLPHEEAYKRIKEFDIAVLPHTLHTGTPIKLLEYAAMGRPIIAPDLPNIRDVFEHNKNIFLFEPGNPTALADAIEILHRNPDYARKLGQAAQDMVKNHTWEKNVMQILERLAL